MKRNKYTYLLFFLLIIPAFACQFLDEIFLEPPNNSNNFGSPPIENSAGIQEVEQAPESNPNIIPTSTLPASPPSAETPEPNSDESEPEQQPDPETEVDTNSSNQATSSLVQPEGFESFSSYISQSGYGFYYPQDWLVAEYFGQAVVTNDPQILQQGGALGDRPIVILLAGSASEFSGSAQERLEFLQSNILSTIAPNISPLKVTLDNGHSQFGSSGAKGVYSLQISEQTYTVKAISLARGDNYVVGLAIIDNDQMPKFETTADNILGSVQLLSDTYTVNPDTYGLTADEIVELEQEVQNLASTTTSTRPIALGESVTTSTASGPIAFEFSADGEAVSISVTPLTQGFDPIIDVVDNSGNSILPNGPVDDALAGSTEAADLQLPSEGGAYRILVRGFGFSTGEFTISLSGQ
ncbi:MAG: hypothetical protein AAF902_16235 [Chloroflexota bacterium]